MKRNRRDSKFLKEEDTDPLSVVVNLFDVAMVFAVALMVAMVMHMNMTEVFGQEDFTIVKNPIQALSALYFFHFTLITIRTKHGFFFIKTRQKTHTLSQKSTNHLPVIRYRSHYFLLFALPARQSGYGLRLLKMPVKCSSPGGRVSLQPLSAPHQCSLLLVNIPAHLYIRTSTTYKKEIKNKPPK